MDCDDPIYSGKPSQTQPVGLSLLLPILREIQSRAKEHSCCPKVHRNHDWNRTARTTQFMPEFYFADDDATAVLKSK
jgi:hypothetical protein